MKKIILAVLILVCSPADSAESVCYGTTSHGKLVNGVRLPSSGANYVGYSNMAGFIGRTYVHSKVRDIVVASYRILESEAPGKDFKYAETGFKNGGEFKPHKTHRNGLSVDFMVPVINHENESVHLPTNIFNKLGYSIEFDGVGRYGKYQIDFDALAAHIVSLHRAAIGHGMELWRVIFDPNLQGFLMKTKYADYLKKHIEFSSKCSWVRHDEHYHVDFNIPCVRE